MLRLAASQDAPRLDEFLAQHAETSMFLRSNLAAHGTDERDHPHGTRFFIWGDVEAVFGITTAGYLMLQAPGAPDAAFASFVQAIAGDTMLGLTGEDTQAQRLVAALGLSAVQFQLNDAEPLYRLDLQNLPAEPIPMRLPQPADLAFLGNWFAGYLLDTQQNTPETVSEPAWQRAQKAAETQSLEILLEGDRPVGMAAINARVADLVQVGGVYVPPEHRKRGLGQQVTAGLLQNARKAGAKTGILFANNAPAARAYEAIGFERIGAYRVVILAEPHAVIPR